MRNTTDVTGDKPIAVYSISGVSAINPLAPFHNIHGRKGEALFFCSVLDTTRDIFIYYLDIIQLNKRVVSTSDLTKRDSAAFTAPNTRSANRKSVEGNLLLPVAL
jgi:hypothetical protein